MHYIVLKKKMAKEFQKIHFICESESANIKMNCIYSGVAFTLGHC